MKKRTIISWILCSIVMLNLLTGCGTEKESIETDRATSNQTVKQVDPELEPVELVLYMLGDPPKDKEMVLKELNKLTKRDLNATVDIKQTTWTDWQTKYNLLLTTGEPIDLITTHTWTDYYKYANQGAYMPLDDLLPKYAPKTWEKMPKGAWKDTRVNGKIYTVPSNFYEFTQHNIIYRDDLRQKYGLDEITTMDEMYNFLDMVAEKEPSMSAYYSSNSNLFMMPSKIVPFASISFIGAKSYGTPRDLVLIPFTDTYKNGVTKNRELFLKGYWSESVLSQTTGPGEDFKNGLTAAITHNLMTAKGAVEKSAITHPEWDVKYFVMTHPSKIYPVVSNSNGMSIPLSAKNPERALMLLDKLRNDKEYYDLTQYGIEGVHYVENEKGEFMLPEGVTESGFPVEGFASWAWRTNEFRKEKANGWDEYQKICDEFKALGNENIFDAFYFDPYPIQAELAAVNNVTAQYGIPLEAGLVDPVEGLKIYQDKLKEAGCDKILEEVSKQFDTYLTARGVE